MIQDISCKVDSTLRSADTHFASAWTRASLRNFEGRVWVLGDNIDTDLLAPGNYMKKGLNEMAKHCLEAIDPDFANKVKPGDVLIAGEGFGIGSSREQAVQVLIALGIRSVIAKSFSRIFYRNAINLGFPLLRANDLDVRDEERLTINFLDGKISQPQRGAIYACQALPPVLVDTIVDGGLMAHLAKRLHPQRNQQVLAP